MATASPVITAGDRLGLTLFLAASIHAVFILGIAFRPEDPANLHAPPSLEVILVQKRNETTRKKPIISPKPRRKAGEKATNAIGRAARSAPQSSAKPPASLLSLSGEATPKSPMFPSNPS